MLSLRASLNLVNVLIHNSPLGAAAAVKHLGVSNFKHYTIIYLLHLERVYDFYILSD